MGRRIGALAAIEHNRRRRADKLSYLRSLGVADLLQPFV